MKIEEDITPPLRLKLVFLLDDFLALVVSAISAYSVGKFEFTALGAS